MNLSLPKKDPSELMLYLWKIQDLPKISEKELLYLISFELFLVSPQKALQLIQNCLKNNILIKHPDDTLSLNKDLETTLTRWQQERKKQIVKREQLKAQKKTTLTKYQKQPTSDFNVLLKAFLDKGTINRAVAVSEDAFDIQTLDFGGGVLIAKVKGSKTEPYHIEINTKEKILAHDCHDFVSRRSKNKQFCKHLARLFLLLKEKDSEGTIEMLNEIAESVSKWNFGA
ncbi:MAG: hypothetical protein BAJALOKI1v1_330016 [Promethearchaeota archaeon]|nr:MAG: hypothetical protein BAJALOKI1v1_330016 [Candidatus Lokiarchaeota archaeon]